MRFAILISLLLFSPSLRAQSFEDRFAVIFIDDETEKKLGEFPLNRSLIAQAVERAAHANARGVVLKFFFDQPKEEAGDKALADSLSKTPVLLQARIDDTEAQPNLLSEQFFLKLKKPEVTVGGKSGWIPLPQFAKSARDVGFVDMMSPSEIPMLESYQGKPVKALALCCLELAEGERAEIMPGKSLRLGAKSLVLDSQNCVPAKIPKSDQIGYLPFHSFLAGSTPTNLIAGKVVIIGYDGAKIQSIDTPSGSIRAHRYFVHTLKGVYEQMQAQGANGKAP